MLISIQWKHKLWTYILFKNNINIELYVLSLLPKYQRLVFAKLLYGILPLGIDTGGDPTLDLKNSTCVLCQCNEIEDEIHFICRCNFLKCKAYSILQ